MANLTVSTVIDQLMQAANAPSACAAIGAQTAVPIQEHSNFTAVNGGYYVINTGEVSTVLYGTPANGDVVIIVSYGGNGSSYTFNGITVTNPPNGAQLTIFIYSPNFNGFIVQSLPTIVAVLQASSITPITDGTYTVGLGVTQNGTITTVSGIITAIQQAS